MDRGEYDHKEANYQDILKQKTEEIDKKLSDEEKINSYNIHSEEVQARNSLELTKRTHGITDKDIKSHEIAAEQKEKSRALLQQAKRNSLIKEAEKQVEKLVFEKYWGRLEARELALGSDDSTVKELKQQKAVEDQQKEMERKNFRPSLDNPHKLEKLKGEYTERFNEKDRDR